MTETPPTTTLTDRAATADGQLPEASEVWSHPVDAWTQAPEHGVALTDAVPA